MRLRHHVDDLPPWQGMTGRVGEAILEAVAGLRGPDAAADLRRRGIEQLHEIVPALDVGPLRDQVLTALRPSLLRMAVAVGRRVLGWEHDFFVDDYLILRVNLPYEIARRADPRAENPGVGRVSEAVRALFQARKTVDPVYDPRGYHVGHPPAAWAHGPHLDSWAGHSRDGRNIWWAIGDVPAEAGMVLYPERAGADLPCDPRTLYLQPGHPLPPPTFLPLRAGEMLVFDPEVLHGTRLNTTAGTRIAISMRLNAASPRFDPDCFYAREFWRRASDIEQGRDEVLHLRREDNLGPRAARPAPPSPALLPAVAGALDPATGCVVAPAPRDLSRASRSLVTTGSHRILVVRGTDGWQAWDAACPHYGRDLSDGGADGERLYCPGCAVGFDLGTGASDCPSLRLRAHRAWADEGTLYIAVRP